MASDTQLKSYIWPIYSLSEVEAYDCNWLSQNELKSGQWSDTVLPQGHNTAKLALRPLLSQLVLPVLWLLKEHPLKRETERENDRCEKCYWFSILCEVCRLCARVSCKFLCFFFLELLLSSTLQANTNIPEAGVEGGLEDGTERID